MQERFCVNCAFCTVHTMDTTLSTCHRTSPPKRDPVSGEPIKVWCSVERQGNAGCGSEGRHYVYLNTKKPSEAKEAFDRYFTGDGDMDIFGRNLKQGS